jgi:UDP-N-acetylglucosamine 2-epimerase (non-hydrolysing)
VTLHRPSNVDDATQLRAIAERLVDIAEKLPLVFPVHPRTRQRLTDFGLAPMLQAAAGVKMTDPLSYIEFMSLVVDCRFALTDSGGVQEETSYLGIPCLTLRDNTERPVTVTLGTNRLVKINSLVDEVGRVLARPLRSACAIPLWDGSTARRVVASLRRHARVEAP